MEKELNKIKELVGVDEDDIPEPDQVFNAVKNKIQEYEDTIKIMKSQNHKEVMADLYKDKIKGLEAENERLEAEIHAYENTEYDDIQDIEELKAENKALKADAEDDKKIYEYNRSIVERQREAHKKTMAEIKNKPFTVIKGDSMTIDFNKIEAMIEENKRLKEANEEQNRIIMDMTDIVD